MHEQRYSHGRFLVREDLPYAGAVREFITGLGFEHRQDQRLVPERMGRNRNSLYWFYFPPAGKELVMKVSDIGREPSLSRRIDLFLTGLIKDYNRIAYRGALELEAAGVPTGRAVAWWTYRTSRCTRKSYFLCEKIQTDESIGDWYNKRDCMTPVELQVWEKLLDGTAAVARRLHAHGVRHGDLQAANFLIRFEDEDQRRFTLHLVDTDHVSKAWITQPGIKRFFDLNCLRRARFDDRGQRQFLRRYLGEDYRDAWWWVLQFWNAGGFKVNRWFRRRGKVT